MKKENLDRAMTPLIKRLEAATGPDRELDLVIQLTLWPNSALSAITRHRRGIDSDEGYSWDIWRDAVVFHKMKDGRCPHNGGYPLPPYTGSIDAARSICSDAKVILANEDVAPDGRAMIVLEKDGQYFIGCARTIELAWCIAALRARGVK